MKDITYRVLDVLSRSIGRRLSITTIMNNIKKVYGTAYYKNTHDEVKRLEKEGYAANGELNFENLEVCDLLSQIDMARKKKELLSNNRIQMLLCDVETNFRSNGDISSISLIHQGFNLKLNQAEFLFIMSRQMGTKEIYKIMSSLQKKHNMKLNLLLVTEGELAELLSDAEANPVKEMLSDKITFFHPQDFWAAIGGLRKRGINVVIDDVEINPAEIDEKDLVYNMERFGYIESGAVSQKGRKICLEYIVTSILIHGDARRINAVPVMLAKSEGSDIKAKYDSLVFLCVKYGVADVLFGLLGALHSLKHNDGMRSALDALQSLGIKEKKADAKSVRRNLVVYHAI